MNTYILYHNGNTETFEGNVSTAMDYARELAEAEKCLVQITDARGNWIAAYNGELL